MQFGFAPEVLNENARHRRERMIVLLGSALLIANGLGWGVLFSLRGQWPLVLLDALQVLLGAGGLWLHAHGWRRPSHYLLIIATTTLVAGMCYWIDIPDAAAGRSLHYWLLPVAGIAVILLQEEPRWVTVVLPALVLALFAVCDQPAFAAATDSPLAASLRGPGEWVNKAAALGSVLLVLQVFVADADRIETRLEKANDKITGLLNMVFPRLVATRLVASGAGFAEHHPECSVLFADIVGFTPLAESLPAQTTFELLSTLFDRFDEVVERHGVTKIKTIGDAYMAVAGLPERQPDHAPRLLQAARDMLAAAQATPQLKLRIGIHSGELTAGVIGRVRQTYDVWGDTVNVAARLESQGLPGRIQISESTRRQLPDDLPLEDCGWVELRGKRAPIRVYRL